MLKFILLCVLATLVLTEDLVLQPRYLEDVPHTRVIGGEVARPHSWPWQVSLQVQSGTSFFHICGGSLISPGWVMTAAHCFDRTVTNRVTHRVVLGAHNLEREDGKEQIKAISRVISHPRWNKEDLSAGFDIALIRLSTEATLNSAVQLAALPPSGQILPNNNPCYITGWGSTITGGPGSMLLKQALLPTVNHQTCSKPDWWGSTVKPTMICAGGGESNSGCHGDSGGPLNCWIRGKYFVHGVTSFGNGVKCNTFQKPTIFTRVSAYINWINKNAR